MVLAPEDAIGTFYKSGLEILVLSDFIIKKINLNLLTLLFFL